MKTKRKEKLIFSIRKLLVRLMSYHLISPSAWRTKMKRKLPAMKELLMQICCTDTLTLSLNMVFTNDDDDDQGCISCGILVSGIRARGVSLEHMENMEMFSCSPN